MFLLHQFSYINFLTIYIYIYMIYMTISLFIMIDLYLYRLYLYPSITFAFISAILKVKRGFIGATRNSSCPSSFWATTTVLKRSTVHARSVQTMPMWNRCGNVDWRGAGFWRTGLLIMSWTLWRQCITNTIKGAVHQSFKLRRQPYGWRHLGEQPVIRLVWQVATRGTPRPTRQDDFDVLIWCWFSIFDWSLVFGVVLIIGALVPDFVEQMHSNA